MSCVHYKFFARLGYRTITFPGLYITLKELKKQIRLRERLKAKNSDLEISDATTREEYTDEEADIPRLSCVIVRRVPVGGVAPPGKTFTIYRSLAAMISSSRPTDSSPSTSLAPPAKDKSVKGPKPVKISKGIPQSFMVKAEPETKGVITTSTGQNPKPAIDAEAYTQGKKERPPFAPQDQTSPEEDSDPILDDLMCPICSHLMTDAVVIPCCGSSYCDDCIRTFLLNSKEHACFTCKQSGVSPDDLVANKFLRQVVNKTPNITGVRKQAQQAALPPPRLQMHYTCQGEPPSPGSYRGHAHGYIAPPPGPPPPGFPAPYLYPPPPQPYPPPYTSGLLPPPPISFLPQQLYAPVSPGLKPPRIPPGVQSPLPHLGPPLSQPPLSKEHCFRQRHRQEKTTSTDYRSRSRIQSRSRSRSPSHGRSYRRSPDSRHNGRTYERSQSRSHSLLLSPPPFRAGPWEGAEGPARFRSRSRSPGGRKPPPRELPSDELKGPSPGGHDRWERERYRQWENEYTDRDNKHYKVYDNPHPSLYHSGRGSRDRQRDRMSPLPRDYSPQRRGREERGAPPQAQKVKPKVKTEAVKKEAIKRKESNTVETSTANPEDHINQLSPKRKRVKLYSEASPAQDPSTVLPDPNLPSLLPHAAHAGNDGEGSVVKKKPRISRKVNISPVVFM